MARPLIGLFIGAGHTKAEPVNGGVRQARLRVELDESAKELILAEGFCKEYGARNLERVVDQMLGTLIAEALLSGKITTSGKIRLEAKDGQIRFQQAASS